MSREKQLRVIAKVFNNLLNVYKEIDMFSLAGGEPGGSYPLKNA